MGRPSAVHSTWCMWGHVCRAVHALLGINVRVCTVLAMYGVASMSRVCHTSLYCLPCMPYIDVLFAVCAQVLAETAVAVYVIGEAN